LKNDRKIGKKTSKKENEWLRLDCIVCWKGVHKQFELDLLRMLVKVRPTWARFYTKTDLLHNFN
jgi:hypothetical protein